MRARRGLQMPLVMTTVSVSMSPLSVRTRRTWPFSTSMPVTSVLATTVRAPIACAFSRIKVPPRSESTVPMPGVLKPPRMIFSLMKGTRRLTSAGDTSSASIPQALLDAMRRLSSSIRSVVRATSTPPLWVKTPSSLYWRTLSSVKSVISLEWSVRKMKFEACPVEPPGLGSGPLSIRTISFQPC